MVQRFYRAVRFFFADPLLVACALFVTAPISLRADGSPVVAGASQSGIPTISQHPQTNTVTIGSTVTFSVVSSSPSPVTYQWFFNRSPVPGATNSTLGVGPVQRTNDGFYSVLVANYAGAVMSQPAELLVTNSTDAVRVYLSRGYSQSVECRFVQLYCGSCMENLSPIGPVLSVAQSASVYRYNGTNFEFPPSRAGQPTYFQLRAWNDTPTREQAWLLGESEIICATPLLSPATTPNLSFKPITLHYWDDYSFHSFLDATGSNTLGGSLRLTAAGITMKSFPYLTNMGLPAYYQWRKDNVVITDATNSTLVITNLQASDAGDYAAVCYNYHDPNDYIGTWVSASHYSLAIDFTPRLTPTRTAERQTFSLFTHPGNPVTIQASSDLTHWDDFSTIVPTNSNLQVELPRSSLPAFRFYRAVLRP